MSHVSGTGSGILVAQNLSLLSLCPSSWARASLVGCGSSGVPGPIGVLESSLRSLAALVPTLASALYKGASWLAVTWS